MADRTVRAIFEAKVSGARKGMTDLSQDVAKAGKSVERMVIIPNALCNVK